MFTITGDGHYTRNGCADSGISLGIVKRFPVNDDVHFLIKNEDRSGIYAVNLSPCRA